MDNAKVAEILRELWRYKDTDKYTEEEIREALEKAASAFSGGEYIKKEDILNELGDVNMDILTDEVKEIVNSLTTYSIPDSKSVIDKVLEVIKSERFKTYDYYASLAPSLGDSCREKFEADMEIYDGVIVAVELYRDSVSDNSDSAENLNMEREQAYYRGYEDGIQKGRESGNKGEWIKLYPEHKEWEVYECSACCIEHLDKATHLLNELIEVHKGEWTGCMLNKCPYGKEYGDCDTCEHLIRKSDCGEGMRGADNGCDN